MIQPHIVNLWLGEGQGDMWAGVGGGEEWGVGGIQLVAIWALVATKSYTLDLK